MHVNYVIGTPIVLLPAYGRTYETPAEIRKDWEAGKDFKVHGLGCYCSIRDLSELRKGASTVYIVSPLPCNVTYRVA